MDEDPAGLSAAVEMADGRRCRTADPDAFFPPEGSRFPAPALFAERRRVEGLCRGCPVSLQCLAAALMRGEVYGSWGGVAQPDYQILADMWRERRKRENAGASTRTQREVA